MLIWFYNKILLNNQREKEKVRENFGKERETKGGRGKGIKNLIRLLTRFYRKL